MKIKYLGTAAAEAFPAIFCSCEKCRRAFFLGGRNLRSRSQALINDDLLIDFPCDTYGHFINNNIDTTKISNLLITHIHDDHLYPTELEYIGNGYSAPSKDFCLNVYGSVDILEKIQRIADKSQGLISVNIVKPFEPFKVGNYTVTALKAWHGTNNPFIYIVTDGDKSVLYAHDTDVFNEETRIYLKSCKIKFNIVSLDCTFANLEYSKWRGHMYLGGNIECRDFLEENGLIDKDSVIVLNHFTHNGVDAVYDDFVKIAEPKGFIVSYDGLEIEV